MPWDPVQDLLTMQGRLESLFGHASPGWVPPADLVESAAEFCLTLELPGLERHDVQIEFHDGTLTVKGRRPDGEAAADRYQQLERSRGAFSRSFQFGPGTIPEAITADLADGVLTIRVPRIGSVEAARIAVE